MYFNLKKLFLINKYLKKKIREKYWLRGNHFRKECTEIPDERIDLKTNHKNIILIDR